MDGRDQKMQGFADDAVQSAYERVMAITDEHDEAERLFISDEQGLAKTAILCARGLERDLLSPKRVVLTHAHELLNALELGTGDRLLDLVGEADVLLLDEFQILMDSATGRRVAELLLAERQSRGLETVLGSSKKLEECMQLLAEDALAGFEELVVS